MNRMPYEAELRETKLLYPHTLLSIALMRHKGISVDEMGKKGKPDFSFSRKLKGLHKNGFT